MQRRASDDFFPTMTAVEGAEVSVAVETGWAGPGAKATRKPFRWSRLVWALVWPQGGERIVPTMSGVMLIAVCFGVGTAAYNSSSNILFITLSLLLACLILSGVVSWLNLSRVAWRLDVAPPLRAGQAADLGLSVRNGKRILPTYGLWFEWSARPIAAAATGAKAESTVTGRGIEVRAILKKAEAETLRGQVALRARLDPAGEDRLDWSFVPARRGRMRVELAGVGSVFPFGFLKKYVGSELRAEVVVWPAVIDYRQWALVGARRAGGEQPRARAGGGSDLLALRRYAAGDSHRLIHWKASARTQQLLVRQFTTESSQGFDLWVRTDAALWPRAEQFEVFVRFASTLAEDLFRVGQLQTIALDGELPVRVRHGRDLAGWLNRLAVVEFKPVAAKLDTVVSSAEVSSSGRNVLTFAPEGELGVVAWINGQRAAST